MAQAFDERIIKVGIELESGIEEFEGLAIQASGSLYGSSILNDCECTIYNLTKEKRDYLLTQTSPFALPRTAKKMTLDVGRESYGTFRLYEGNVIAGNPTQPPDIGITLRSLTNSFMLGNILASSQPTTATLSAIAKQVAADNGLTLNFKATDKNIENYSFTGGSQKQVDKLARMGGVDAFVINGTLVVKDRGKALPGSPRLINSKTGMVGIPDVTEQGVRVKVMMDNSLKLGGSVTIESELNPAANGTFTIYKLNFEVANREVPFWYVVEASPYVFGTNG